MSEENVLAVCIHSIVRRMPRLSPSLQVYYATLACARFAQISEGKNLEAIQQLNYRYFRVSAIINFGNFRLTIPKRSTII